MGQEGGNFADVCDKVKYKRQMVRFKTVEEKYVPIPYFRKTKEGIPIPRKQQAQNIAEFLADNIWKQKRRPRQL